ncbi:MAG: antibiotic biosynthesis monooxygenase [Chitinophagales bacterium]|nr:antibiotic biosynthesis monooxygenase [Chitinophagales bacterium]MDW8419247.1 antibiotic biosynthesis monooxygenase [Chitinophagales bacterium]
MSQKKFVAINYIQCNDDYRERFEQLFATRAHAIDRMPGFYEMHVLKPSDENGNYLIMSFWESEEHFKAWTNSPEFIEGHKRGFADIAKAKAEGKEPPMKSTFKTYTVIAN